MKKTFKCIYNHLTRTFEFFAKDENKSDFRLFIYDTVHKVPADEWDSCVSPSDLFLTYNFLKAIEESKPEYLSFRYGLIYNKNNCVAVLYFQLLEVDLNRPEEFVNISFYREFIQTQTNGIAQTFINHFFIEPFTLIINGSVFLSNSSGIRINIPDKEYKKILSHALPCFVDEVVFEVSKSKKVAGIVMKDFHSNDPILEVLSGVNGFEKFQFEPNMALKLESDWKTFEDYLEALSSKYRLRTKNALKKAEVFKVIDMDTDLMKKYSNEIKLLYDAVHNRAIVKLSKIKTDYFIQLKKRLADNFFIKGIFLENKLVGFYSYFILDIQMEAHLVGLDYIYNKTLSLYQNILYFYIKDAFRCHTKIISFGRTAIEIKSTVGARSIPLYNLISLKKPLSNSIIKSFLKTSSGKTYTERGPFKENVN